MELKARESELPIGLMLITGVLLMTALVNLFTKYEARCRRSSSALSSLIVHLVRTQEKDRAARQTRALDHSSGWRRIAISASPL